MVHHFNSLAIFVNKARIKILFSQFLCFFLLCYAPHCYIWMISKTIDKYMITLQSLSSFFNVVELGVRLKLKWALFLQLATVRSDHLNLNVDNHYSYFIFFSTSVSNVLQRKHIYMEYPNKKYFMHIDSCKDLNKVSLLKISFTYADEALVIMVIRSRYIRQKY